MKKQLVMVMLFTGFISIQACELTIKNDTGQFVQVHDLNTNEKIWILPSTKRVIGKNPDIHANFVMTTQNTIFGTATKYEGKQTACSKEHKINLNVSDIEKGKFDSSLMQIKKG